MGEAIATTKKPRQVGGASKTEHPGCRASRPNSSV